LVVSEELEGFINMHHMCFPGFVIDQDIIKEYKHKIVQEGLKNLIHEDLKGGGNNIRPRGHTKNS
jgi:hypothetical protein